MKLKKFPLIVLSIVFVGCYGLAYVLAGMTLSSMLPIAVCVVCAVLTGLTMWRFWQRITASDKMHVNYLCHLVVASGLLMALTFGLNSGLADGSTLHAERCVVENLRVEEHYRSNRVARHVYRPVQKYYAHEVELRFPDGESKSLRVSGSYYRKLHCGDTININVKQGFFHPRLILSVSFDLFLKSKYCHIYFLFNDFNVTLLQSIY